MFILKRNGDTTIKRLNLDLFFMGVPLVRGTNLCKCQKVISQLIFEILEKSFLHSTSLE